MIVSIKQKKGHQYDKIGTKVGELLAKTTHIPLHYLREGYDMYLITYLDSR